MKRQGMPRWARSLSITAMIGIAATGCGASDEPSGSPDPSEPVATVGAESNDSTPIDSEPASTAARVVSAEEGIAARGRYQPLERSTEAASGAAVADMSSTMDCPNTYVPTPEEVAASNADNEGLIAVFDRFGIEYTSSTDPVGYLMVEYTYDDIVAQSVADSYWNDRYPVEPIPQAELDAIVAQNDVVAEQLDAAGVGYERRTDASGYESLEYDYDDPAAQAAVDAAWLIISPPQPPTPEQLAQQTDDNAKLTNAFDEAGVAYELVTDELGWAWVEWDYEDPATAEQVNAIIDELYPPITIDPIEECAFVQEPIAIDMPTIDEQPIAIDEQPIATDAEPVEPVIEPLPADPILVDPMPVEPIPVDAEPTPEYVAQRAADVDAMVAGFTAASVDFDLVGESPWQSIVFDLDNESSVSVIGGILAGRT